MPNVTAIQKHVSSILKAGLSASLTYHNIDHTMDVTAQCLAIATAEGITDEEVLQELQIAALYHDVGFIYVYDGHEKISCDMAMEQLPGFNIGSQTIKNICELIMVTKIPQAPQNKVQQIICDADLDYFGRDDFFTISNRLQQEVLAYKKAASVKEWKIHQVAFLESHHYFTKTAQLKRTPVKLLHLKKLLEEQQNIRL